MMLLPKKNIDNQRKISITLIKTFWWNFVNHVNSFKWIFKKIWHCNVCWLCQYWSKRSSIDKWGGGPGQKPQNGRIKFLNILILEHLKNHFIEPLHKFLMCFEINGLKNLKLTILLFFARTPHLSILL